MLLLSSPLSHLFIFEKHGDHRYLHSFPTRRSSDLRSVRRAPRCVSQAAGRNPRQPELHPVLRRNSRRSDRRSEEHTSELQSHHDLVCRLLLEKKKKWYKDWYTCSV